MDQNESSSTSITKVWTRASSDFGEEFGAVSTHADVSLYFSKPLGVTETQVLAQLCREGTGRGWQQWAWEGQPGWPSSGVQLSGVPYSEVQVTYEWLRDVLAQDLPDLAAQRSMRADKIERDIEDQKRRITEDIASRRG